MDFVSSDLQISWFCNDAEIRQSDVFRMSALGETFQLDISRVLSTHEGEYSCVASNLGGSVTCAATLNIDGEFLRSTRVQMLHSHLFVINLLHQEQRMASNVDVHFVYQSFLKSLLFKTSEILL